MDIEIGLATEEEIDDVTGAVVGKQVVKDTLDDWRIVSLRGTPPGGTLSITEALVLVGIARARQKMVCTSHLVAIDRAKGRARTHSGSLYRLGTPADGGLSPGLLLALTQILLT